MGTEVAAGGAREEVLRRIRAALADAPKLDEAAIRSEWEMLPRNYTRTASLGHEAILELLEDRLRDYDANVVRANHGDAGAAMAKLLGQRGARRLVVPVGLAEAVGEALPEGFEFVTDHGLTVAELDGFAGVVTASTVAIAETGTIVLQNVPGQGRRGADTGALLSPVRGPGWRCGGNSSRGHGAVIGDCLACDHICVRAVGYRRHRDDSHQRSSRAAVSGRTSDSVTRKILGSIAEFSLDHKRFSWGLSDSFQ